MSLGALVTKFGADTRGFDSGVNRVKGGLSGIGAGAAALLNPVTAGFAAIVAGAASAGIAVYSFAGRIADLAGIADKAAQTGLSGSFLQQMAYAADQSGVSAETLTGGVKRLAIAIGQASSSSDAAAKKFTDIGISLTELQGLSPEQQFLRVAEQIGKIPTAAGRAAAAVKVFGKSSIEMTTLFRGGLNDINKLLGDAAALGIGINDAGLAKAAEADDAIQKMKASFGAMMDQVAVGLAPAFTAVSEEVAKLIAPVTLLFAQFNQLDDKFQFTADLLSAAFDVATETIKAKWGAMLTGIIASAQDAALAIADLMNPVKQGRKLGQALGLLGIRPAAAKEDGLGAAQKRLGDVWAQMNKGGAVAAPTFGIGGGGDIPIGGEDPKAKANTDKERAKRAKGTEQWLADLWKDTKKGAGDLGKGAGKLAGAVAGGASQLFADMGKPKTDPGFASVMLKGSAAAVNTINAAGRTTPAIKLQQQQLKEQKDSNKHLKKVADNSKPMFAPEFA